MTCYNGGKQRIGKRLSSIISEESLDIEDEYDFTIKGYCEPFCGMLGVYQHIPELFDNHVPKLKYKAGDINKSVIKMWDASQKGYIIYCDPPYPNTYYKHYGKVNFDHDDFWNWCRKMSKDNIVFVSSYTAPKDFEEIFSSTHKLTGVVASGSKKRVEKLF